MNTSRKAVQLLTCFSIVNLILGCFLFKKLRNLMKHVPCQKQLQCHSISYIKFKFVKFVLISPFRFVKARENTS